MLLFQSLLDKVEVAVVFLVMISLLVAAHEYGHYLFARIFKMGVEEFAIGFGRKPILIWRRKMQTIRLSDTEADQQGLPRGSTIQEETQYTIRPWPIGGFVRIKGMVPEEDGSEIHVGGGFYSKPAWQRFLVLLAGPVFSIGAGILLFFVVTMATGIPTREAIVNKVAPNTPAYSAGIREGDRIVKLDSTVVKSFEDVAKFDRKPGVPILVEFERAGARMKALVVPVHLPDPRTGKVDMTTVRLGVEFGKLVPVPPGPALAASISVPYVMVTSLASQLSQHKVAVEDTVGGPASMVSATSDAVHNGVAAVIETAALLSISVGIFNLFPIGFLDGGQMLIALIEIFRRRRLSIQFQAAFMNVGAAIVITMFICVIFIDAKRFLPFGKDKPSVTQTKAPSK